MRIFGGLELILEFIFFNIPFNFFSSSVKVAIAMPSARFSDGAGVSERFSLDSMSSKLTGRARTASPIGAGGVGVSGKKTVSKLDEGDVGHNGARWWNRVGSNGEEVLGELFGHKLLEFRHKCSEFRLKFSGAGSWGGLA